jgi:hypothetical protein
MRVNISGDPYPRYPYYVISFHHDSEIDVIFPSILEKKFIVTKHFGAWFEPSSTVTCSNEFAKAILIANMWKKAKDVIL